MASSIDSRPLYDEQYFLSQVDGHDQYGRFDGSPSTLFPRARRNLEILQPAKGQRILELAVGEVSGPSRRPLLAQMWLPSITRRKHSASPCVKLKK